jgi:general secretion pathway protein J
VEVMVAISVLSLLALMGWRGLDTQLRTRERVAQQMNGVAQLQTALAQWNTDLQAMTDMGTVRSVPALDYDGLVLRITRIDASLSLIHI